MATRSRPADLDAAAELALDAALAGLGLRVKRGAGPHDRVVDVDGTPLRLEVHGASVVDHGRAATQPSPDAKTAAIPLLVADKITAPARTALNQSGWSWLDRRGHLRLRGEGVLIDAEVEPQPRESGPRRATDALASRGGREVAVALLLDEPDDSTDRPGVRELARRLGLSPSTVSRALAELREAGLARKRHRPVVPDLFWALADHWQPQRHALATEPLPTDERVAQMGASIGDIDGPGWAVGDTRAALAWGAPVVASTDAPAALYVPDEPSLQSVLRSWRPAPGLDVRGPTVAVAPVSALARRRFLRPPEAWPVVHPLFAALDLANDRARGPEVLEGFDPEGFPRVW